MNYKQPKPIAKINRDIPVKRRKKLHFPFHFFTILTVIIFLVVLIAAIHSYFYFYRRRPLVLQTTQKTYKHLDFVEFYFDYKDGNLDPLNLMIGIEKNSVSVPTIGGVKGTILKYNQRLHRYEGSWPVPWNAADGQYTAKMQIPQKNKGPLLLSTNFEIQRLIPPPIKPGLGILTLESTAYLTSAKIKNTKGEKGNWENIFDWGQFLGADAIWYLAGQTSSWGAKIDNNYPWIKSNIDFVPQFAKAAHNRGFKFGAWVACYLTFGDQTKKADYNYAYNYDAKAGTCVLTRSISIGDTKRRADIIKLLKYLSNIAEVDYLGLDYIRNAIGGYEMVDQFVAEMNPELPANWKKLDKMARMCWLGKEIQHRQKMKLVDQWNWWRAHYVANIVKEIKAGLNTDKPLWCYTLSWQKGWQHGQDPIMMNDAGADLDAVMLYECDRGQFNDLIKEWSRYVGKNQVNLLAGDVVDWNLHQKVINPPGPQEFYERLMLAHHKMSADGKIKGFFWHDLARGLWGRLGPYSINEWAIAGAAALSQLRQEWGLMDLELDTEIAETMAAGQNYIIKAKIKNISQVTQKNITLNFLSTPHVISAGPDSQIIKTLEPQQIETVSFSLKITDSDPIRAYRNMIALSCQWDSAPRHYKIVKFKYVKAH